MSFVIYYLTYVQLNAKLRHEEVFSYVAINRAQR